MYLLEFKVELLDKFEYDFEVVYAVINYLYPKNEGVNLIDISDGAYIYMEGVAIDLPLYHCPIVRTYDEIIEMIYEKYGTSQIDQDKSIEEFLKEVQK